STYQLLVNFQQNVPVAGAIASWLGSLAKQAPPGSAWERYLRRAGGTNDVLELRERALQDDQTLPRELMSRFAKDLGENLPKRSGRLCRGVLFLDSYERLWTGREADRSVQARRLDRWVRDLANACRSAGLLLVISGRDRLQWEDDDLDWESRLDQH